MFGNTLIIFFFLNASGQCARDVKNFCIYIELIILLIRHLYIIKTIF